MSFWQWIQSVGFTTQSAHFFSGAAVTLVASLWLPPLVAAAIFFGVWVAPKELVVDACWFGENHGSPDWLDLLFYVLGIGVALGFLALKYGL